MRLRIAIDVGAIVQNLDQSDPRLVELRRDVDRMIVAALVDLVPLERRPDEDRQHQLAVLTHEGSQRKHGAGAGALPTRADRDDDGYGAISCSIRPRLFSACAASAG